MGDRIYSLRLELLIPQGVSSRKWEISELRWMETMFKSPFWSRYFLGLELTLLEHVVKNLLFHMTPHLLCIAFRITSDRGVNHNLVIKTTMTNFAWALNARRLHRDACNFYQNGLAHKIKCMIRHPNKTMLLSIFIIFNLYHTTYQTVLKIVLFHYMPTIPAFIMLVILYKILKIIWIKTYGIFLIGFHVIGWH